MLPHQYTTHGTKTQIHLQFCVEAADRTGIQDCCPVVVTVEQVVHENDKLLLMQSTVSGACYVTRTEECLSIDSMFSMTLPLHSARVCRSQRVLLALCACSPQTAVYRCKHVCCWAASHFDTDASLSIHLSLTLLPES
jgi:hypothetical protein